MDIGTAKPTQAELGRVPHHLLDIREVSEPMNAALYATLALRVAEEIWGRGRSVLVVGGSGFYLKTYFAPVADGRTVPPEVRFRVAGLLERDGLPALVQELLRLNPGGLGDLDTDNPRRIARALERCLASGRTLAELSSEFARVRPAFAGWEVRLTRLDRSRPDLEARIGARVDAMLSAGLVAEVTRLSKSGLRSNPSAARAIGYRETLEVLEGRLPMADLREAIARDTLALVKKQRTWFRTQLPPHAVLEAAELKDEALLFP
jgi:tRNA dimethylallyltransferase